MVTGNGGVVVRTTGGTIDFASGAGAQSLADVSVSASGALTNAGTLAAGGTASASGSSIISGEIVANGGVTLIASGDIAVTNIIDSGTNASLTSSAGAIRVNTRGGVLSGGAISLSAATILENAGDLSAETSVDAVAGGALSNSGFIFSALGNTRLGGSALTLGGDVYSARALTLDADTITIDGSVGSNDAFSLLRGNLNVLNTGLLQSNSGITLSLGSAQIDGTLRALGSLGLSATMLGVGTNGLIDAGSNLSVSVSGALDNRGLIGAEGTLDLSAATLLNSGKISASSDVTVSGGALDVSGLFESGRNLRVTNASTNITGTGVLTASGTLDVNSNSVTSAGSLLANGNVSVTGRSTLGLNSGAILSNLGSISLTSNGAATVGSSIDAATSASISGASIALSGDIVANGAVSLTANNGALDIMNTIDSGAAITLNANNGALSLSRAATLFGASGISAGAQSLDIAGDLLSPGNVTLNAANGLTLSGNLLSNNAANLSAGTALIITNGGSIDARSANLTADTLIARGTVDASNAITLSARSSASIENRISAGGPISFTAPGRVNLDVTSTGRLISGSAITLNNIANLSVAGLVSAASDVTADFAGSANILGRIEAGNDVRLTNNGAGATSVGDFGVIAAGNDIVISGGALSVAGLAYAGRDFSFATGSFDGNFNSLTVDGTLAAGRNIALSLAGGLAVTANGLIAADGNISSTSAFANIAGDVAAGGSLGFTTRGDNGAGASDFILSGNLQSTGALSIAGANGVNIMSNGRVISDSNVTITGPSVTALGTIGAGDLVSITATGNILHGGLIQSGRRIAVNAGGTITLQSDSRIETIGNAASIGFARDAGAAANIDVRAGGAISAVGTLFSDGAIALKSGTSNISNSGTITGLNDVVLQAEGGSVTNDGTITGTNLALYQGVDFFNTGSFTAVGNLLLSAPSITNSGLLGSGGSLALRTPGSLLNQSGGTIFAGGTLTIEAGGGITNDLSTILAVGDIALTAPSLLNNSARIESLGGSVSIAASNVINQIKTLSITPGMGSGGTPAGLYDGQGNFNGPIPDPQDCQSGAIVCQGETFIILQAYISPFTGFGYNPGTYTFRDAVAGTGGNDTVTFNSGASAIVAAQDVTITTGSNTTGTVTNNNSSILAGRNISITAGTLNNIATLINRTQMRDIIEIQRQRFVEDANIPCPATAIPGTCMTSTPPEFRTTWEEFVEVVVGQETVQVQDPLPTLINAGGTVFLDVGTLNNNQPTLNGQALTPGADTRGGTGAAGANAQGGRGSFVDPNAPAAGVTNAPTAATTATGGATAQTNGIAVAFNGGGALNTSIGTGDGAGALGTARAIMIGAGGALLDAGVAGPAVSGGVSGADTADQRGAGVGRTLADDSADTAIAGSAALANAGGADTMNLAGTGTVRLDGTNSGGGAGVGTDTLTPGGFVNSLVNGLTNGGNANANGAGAASVGLVSTAGVNGATTPGGIQTSAIAGVDAVDADAALVGASPQSAQLVDGFGGLAIPDILGSNGQAGGFVLDFLRSFGLTANGGGFGIAGGGSLFTFNNNPDSQFLFTTNPGFASVGDLFDSQFFFDQLGIDRSTRFTRLGDGFFEAQLIGKQVQAATGQAQLGAFGDSFAQARGLLEAGVAEAKRLQLSVGVALTGAQVANLKTSIVWYVKSTVQGREVLVPVVYLAASDQKSIKGGAIISGTNVVANVAGSITNNGSITAKNIVSLTAGGDIVNQAGGRISGGTVIASAARDILAQGGSAISGGNILLAAGRDISLSATTSATSTSERKDFGKKGFTQSSSTTQTATGAEVAASGNLVMSAGRDITLTAAKVSAGGDASLSAGRDVTITGITTTDTTETASRTVKKGFLSKKVTTTSSSTSTETFNGSSLAAGGNLSVSAGNALTIKGSDIASGGNATLIGAGGVSIVSATEAASADSAFKSKKKSTTTAETSLTNRLSGLSAGGNLAVGAVNSAGVSSGNVQIAGADLSAGGAAIVQGQNITVTGVIDSASFDATSRTVKKGLASKKVTTTTQSSDTQAVVASTISGGTVSLGATGDISVRGSNIVSDNGTVLQAGGAISIGTLEAKSSESQSVKVKKSGISLSGSGLFAGVAKNSNASTLETVTNTGSLVGAANGDVSINATKALTITGSQVAAPGRVALSGKSVTIQNATDTANSTSLSKSSSFGLSIKAYENVSGAVKSVATLADRIGKGAKGGAAATGITAASETLRTVSAVTNALTNTAGVSANLGFSKSKSTSASQESAVVGSGIAGGTVNITATGTDVRVTGSNITSTGATNINAARDIILESAQNTLATQSKSSSSGASIGVSVGVAVVGGVTASASVGVSGSKSSGSSSETTQVNSSVTAGGTLSLTSGRDATLKGAVAEGKDVVASIGRDLNLVSVQDETSRKSSSKGFSAGLTLAPGVGLGVNGGVNVGKGSGASSIVAEQTALIAREGSLAATVKGNTDIKGGVIAALDADGKDTGRLVLNTATLSATDIKDSAKSKDVSVGISASINNVTDRNTRSANLPVVDGSFASSSFKQDTKATIGQGVLNVGVPSENVTINRDVTQSQVVTKDKSTAFTVNADIAAAKELVSLVKGVAGNDDAKANSVILQGVNNLVNDPLRIVRDAANEIKAITDRDITTESQTGELIRLIALKLGVEASGVQLDDALNIELQRAKPQLDALAAERDAALVRAETARASGDAAGAAAATAEAERAENAIGTVRTSAATSAISRVAIRRNASAPQRELVGNVTRGSDLVSRSGALIDNGIPTAPPPEGAENEDIIVTGYREGTGPTVGRIIVDTSVASQRFVNSLNPTLRSLTITGIRAAATGGTAPLINLAVEQGAGVIIPQLPSAILDPLARVTSAATRFLGDGGTAFLVGPSGNIAQDFNTVSNDNSAATRTDSGGVSFISGIIVGSALSTITAAAQRFNRNRNNRNGNDDRTCSFHGDTFVKTLMGYTQIRDIKAGKDQVWARDAVTGKMGYKRVEAHYSNPYDVTVRVSIRDAETGRDQVLVSNKIHSFFVQLPEGVTAPPSSEGHSYNGDIARGAWVDAANLKAGYRLLNDDGSWASVTGITVEQAPLSAYNMKVEGYHTYFVTGSVDASPVWVHNDCNLDVREFEQSLVNLPPGERVARVRSTLRDVAASNGYVRDSRLSRINGRDVYRDPATGNLYAVDSQQGRFEVTNSRGRHQGEVNIAGQPIQGSLDRSGRHDLRI
jgi:filamentous hemagglutinin